MCVRGVRAYVRTYVAYGSPWKLPHHRHPSRPPVFSPPLIFPPLPSPLLPLQGTYAWPDGRRYEGQWEENRMHGLGVYRDARGHKWEGQFFNGSGPGLTCQL